MYLEKFNSKEELVKEIAKEIKKRGELGINKETVNRWERGERGVSPFYYSVLCKVLGKNEVEICVTHITTKRGNVVQKEEQTREEKLILDNRSTPKFNKSDYVEPLVEWIERQRKTNYFVKRKFIEVGNVKKVWKEEDILNSNENLVILGEPGSGKTSLLQTIALELCNRKNVEIVPIFVSLNEYVPKNKNTLLERIREENRRILSKSISDEDLYEEDFLFLLDNLDSSIEPINTTSDINSLCADEILSKHRFVIACNPDMFNFYNLVDFVKIIIKDLTIIDIKKILVARVGSSNSREVYAFLSHLNEEKWVELAQKPIWLYKIFELFDEYLNKVSLTALINLAMASGMKEKNTKEKERLK